MNRGECLDYPDRNVGRAPSPLSTPTVVAKGPRRCSPAGQPPAARRSSATPHHAQRRSGDPVHGRAPRAGAAAAPRRPRPAAIVVVAISAVASPTMPSGCSPSCASMRRSSTSAACRGAPPTRSGCPASSDRSCRSSYGLLAIWTAGLLLYVARGGGALVAAGWALLTAIVTSSGLLPGTSSGHSPSQPPRRARGSCWPRARSAPPTRSATRRPA
jgi:hypothetical protein